MRSEIMAKTADQGNGYPERKGEESTLGYS
jgi:hypothetical protein